MDRSGAEGEAVKPLHFETREDWLAARKKLGVGSSEVSALFSRPDNPLRGLSAWASPYSLWCLKTEVTKEDDRAEDFIEWGSVVEPAIANWFDERIREEVEPLSYLHDPGRWTVFLPDDDCPWFASVDRLLNLGSGTVAVVEIKNASAFIASEWEDEPPLPYQLQVQQQLAILGLDHGYICASIGGAPPRWARINRDEKVIGILKARVREFWRHVEQDDPPPTDGSKATGSALLYRYPEDDGSEVELSEGAMLEWDRRCEVHAQIGDLSLVKDGLTNSLKNQLGEHSFGRFPDGRSLSNRKNKAGNRILREVERD